MDHRDHRGVSSASTTPAKLAIFGACPALWRDLPGLVHPARSQWGCAPAPGRPSSPVSKARCDGSAPDVFALDHPGAGFLPLRHGRTDPCLRGRPAAGAVSRPMHGDRHPWQPPCRHGWHVAPGPRQGRRRLGEVVAVFRRRARNAPDQVTSAGLCMGMTWPVSSQRRMASQRLCIIGHRRPSRRSARVTHHTTDASSVRGPRPWGPPQAFPRHGGRGRIGRVRSHVHHHAHQRRVMEPADRTGQSESSDWHRRVCASSWRRSEATPHEP